MGNYQVKGDHNYYCQECGRRQKASAIKKRWDGAFVCSRCFELRNPVEYQVYKEKPAIAYPTNQVRITSDSDRDFSITDISGASVSYTCGANTTIQQMRINRSVSLCTAWETFEPSLQATETTKFGDATINVSGQQGGQRSLALNEDGTILVSGLPNSTHISTGGGVNIWQRTGNSWAIIQQLTNPGSAPASDEFGNAVDITPDGNIIVVGARSANHATTPVTDGRVWIYKKSGGLAWVLDHNIGPSDDPAAADFGWDVSISSDGIWLVVGAPAAGQIYIYENVNGTFVERQIRTGSLTISSFYARAVNISKDGKYIAVGDYGNDTGTADKGAVFIYEKDTGGTGNWGEQAALQSTYGWNVAQEQFGGDVALSCDGTYLLVGCRNANRVGGPAPGGVREGAIERWKRTNTSWAFDYTADYQKSLTSGSGQLGEEVVIATTGAVGFAGGSLADLGVTDAGVVEGYDFSVNNDYTNMLASVRTTNDHYGTSLALSTNNKVLVVGAPDQDTYASNGGALYYFAVAL